MRTAFAPSSLKTPEGKAYWYLFHEGDYVVAWEFDSDRGVRITPGGMVPEVFIPSTRYLDVLASEPIRKDPAYLRDLRNKHARFAEATTAIACLVPTRKIAAFYPLPSETSGVKNQSSILSLNKMMPAYEERNGWYRIDLFDDWIPPSAIEARQPFKDRGRDACERRPSKRSYRFSSSTAFHAGASSQTRVTGFSEVGETVQTITTEVPGGWFRVEGFSGRKGWFRATDLVASNTPRSAPPVDLPLPLWGSVTASVLNVRDGPSANTKVVHTLTKDSRVFLFERGGGWWRITKLSSPGRVGWVSASHIEVLGRPPDPWPNPPYFATFDHPLSSQGSGESRQDGVGPKAPPYRSVYHEALLPLLLLPFLVTATLVRGLERDAGDYGVWLLWVFIFTFLIGFIPAPEGVLVVFGLYGLCAIYWLYELFLLVHYLMVPHPLEDELRRAVDNRAAIDLDKLERIVAESMGDLPKRGYKLKNRTRRVRRLIELLRAEQELFQELLGRERLLNILEKLEHYG